MVYLWLTMSRSGTVASQWERRLISYGLSEGALASPQKQNRKVAKSAQQSAMIYSVASGNIRSGSVETRIL